MWVCIPDPRITFPSRRHLTGTRSGEPKEASFSFVRTMMECVCVMAPWKNEEKKVIVRLTFTPGSHGQVKRPGNESDQIHVHFPVRPRPFELFVEKSG